MRHVRLQYGTTGLDVDLDAPSVTVLEPAFVPGLADEAAAFREAVRAPIGSAPLGDAVRAGDRVAVVIPDVTRPLPSHRILPWVFGELSHVGADRVTIVNGTGSHRANTREELERMVGRDVFERFRVVNHDAHDRSTLALAGTSPEGQPVFLQRDYVEADRRVILGFIEPHFMAGFSGGYKAVFPGVADVASIVRYHRAEVIAHPRSTWGVLDGNPTQAQIRACGSLLPVDFAIHVTMNRDRGITRFFCGDVLASHAAGCAFARETAMAPFDEPFSIVLTTNGGYPLDQNLYQAVKGMSAAAQVVEEGGLILAAARCNDGFPAHGNFRKLLFEHRSPAGILETVLAPGFSLFDQWEAQVLAMVLGRAHVGLKSEIPPDEVRRAHLEPIEDIAERVHRELGRRGRDTRIAVLPEGPMTIPYLR